MADVVISRADARAKGLKRFFTGLECPNGHVAQNYTATGKCVLCSNKAKALWASQNKERVRAYNAEWHCNHAEERKAYGKARYSANIDKERVSARARAARRWKENKELVLQQIANWKSNNPEKVRKISRASQAKYRRNNPEIVRLRKVDWANKNRNTVRGYTRKRRAMRLAASGSHTVEDLKDILRLQKSKCAYCRVHFSKIVIPNLDHIVPLSKGGTEDRKNLQYLCKPCNSKKNNLDPIDFSRRQGMLL